MTTKHHLVLHTPGYSEDGIKQKAVDLIVSGLLFREGLDPKQFDFRTFSSPNVPSQTLVIISHSCSEVLDRLSKLIVETIQGTGSLSIDRYMMLEDESLRLLQTALCKDQIASMLGRSVSPFIIVLIGEIKDAMRIEAPRKG